MSRDAINLKTDRNTPILIIASMLKLMAKKRSMTSRLSTMIFDFVKNDRRAIPTTEYKSD
jgi:hypothetical protein